MKFYPPHYLLLLSLCMLSTWYFGNTEPQSFYFMILGLSLIGLGFVFALNSMFRFRKAETGIVPFSKSTTLILEGFYKFTRNPMYVGMNVFLIGLLITLNNFFNLVFVIIFFLIVRNLFVLKEEVQMEETFGEEYLSYKKKVRRWL